MGECGLWSLLGEDINISNAISNHHVGASGKLAVETSTGSGNSLWHALGPSTQWSVDSKTFSSPEEY